MKFLLTPMALALVVLPFAATAQTATPATSPDADVTRLDTIVATPARGNQNLADVYGDVSVISKDQLQNAGATSLTELLSRQPQIQTYQQGGPQSLSGLFVRGASPQQTLVMVDGQRINDPATGSTYLSAIDPTTVERVEILRGAASSLYGSDAMGGVINIITRSDGQDKPLSVFGNIGVGTHSLFKAGIGLSGASNGWDYRLAGSYASSDGFNATRDTPGGFTYNPDRDGYEQASLSGSVGYTWKPGNRLGVSFYNGYNHGDFDSGLYDRNTFGIMRQQSVAVTSNNQLTDWWESVLHVSVNRNLYDARASYGDSVIGSIQRTYSWQNNFRLNQQNRLSLVLERKDESVFGTTTYEKDKRHTNAVGLIYRGDFNRHHIQASLRNDNTTGYDDKTTGSLSYDFDITSEWSAGLAANTGYRIPTFADLYTPLSFGYQGNPNLKPETSRSFELRTAWKTEDSAASVTAWQTKHRDLIDGYVCDEMFNCTSENVDRATIRGISINAEHRFDQTRVYAGADFMNPKDNESGKQLIRRARQVYRVGASHTFGQASIGADFVHTGTRYDDKDNTREKRLGSYGVLNLRASYAFSKNLEAQVYWNNVLDKKYETSYGYNTEGSNVFLNLAFRM